MKFTIRALIGFITLVAVFLAGWTSHEIVAKQQLEEWAVQHRAFTDDWHRLAAAGFMEAAAENLGSDLGALTAVPKEEKGESRILVTVALSGKTLTRSTADKLRKLAIQNMPRLDQTQVVVLDGSSGKRIGSNL